jgi:DNA-binding transcriptional MerR regulator
MKVTALAKLLNTSADTVRFYTRIGLLTPLKDEQNGYKFYNETQQQRLRFILSARQLGFTVDDIRQIFEQSASEKSACPLVRKIIEKRLAEIEQQFQQTQKLREKMINAMDDWRTMPDKEPNGHSICHLIESFTHE